MRKIGLSIAMVLLVGILAACSQDAEEDDSADEQTVSVETTKAEAGDLVIDQSLYGRSKPDKTTPVMVENPGEVTELKVAEGDNVAEDDHLATIETAAGDKTIKAPEDGEVANVDIAEGDIASDSDPLMVIADMDTMTLELTVTSEKQRDLETDDTYTALFDDVEYDADITSVSSMPDDSGLYPVEASVDNDDGNILSGMIAELIVPKTKVKDGLIIPTEAVVTESGESFVYVIEDDQAVKKEVTVEESQSKSSAVEGDIQEGDEIVTNGLLTLSDGDDVDVIQGEDQS